MKKIIILLSVISLCCLCERDNITVVSEILEINPSKYRLNILYYQISGGKDYTLEAVCLIKDKIQYLEIKKSISYNSNFIIISQNEEILYFTNRYYNKYNKIKTLKKVTVDNKINTYVLFDDLKSIIFIYEYKN